MLEVIAAFLSVPGVLVVAATILVWKVKFWTKLLPNDRKRSERTLNGPFLLSWEILLS